MKATGVVRRIDDLGRVVIPKEIRKTLRIKEGEPLEIFTDREGQIILKKYSPIGELSEFAAGYAETLSKTTGHIACITDKDTIIAVSGGSKKEFLEQTTKRKIDINKQIMRIDETINDKELLQKEYVARNEQLSLEKKIFSMRILAKIMEEEKKEKKEELEKLNRIMNPQNFVKYQKELEEKHKYLEVLNSKNDEKELEKLKIKLQELFLKMLKIKIKKTETKQEIEKIIYDFRYYLLLPYNHEKKVYEIESIKRIINEVLEVIINKAIDFKVLEKISENNETNNEVLKNIFKVRIIKLEKAYLKITKEKDKYFVQIFDENIFEERIEIQKPVDLNIKLNKKIPIWG